MSLVNQLSGGSVTISNSGGALTTTGAITTTGGSITLTADSISFGAAVDAGAAVVTLQPFTTTQAIALGVASSPGTLGISDSDLGNITASVVQVGNSSDSAGIAVSGAVTRHPGYSTLSLTTGGSITQTAPLSVANLALQSGAGIALTNAGNATAAS